MMLIKKIQALATVQDLGRYGWRRFGVGHAGAMDTLALRAGNILLGNDEHAPAIEIALGSMVVVFERDASFCLTGAFYDAHLDHQPVYSYWRYVAKKGQVLTLNRAVHGVYAYLCVNGGVAVEAVLGSCATDTKARFGGWQGRCLREQDVLPLGDDDRILGKLGVAPIALTNRVHAVVSSEYEFFSKVAQYRFWQNQWQLQSDSNRMGFRLKGLPLQLAEPLEMLSHAVQFGTVQVPPSGQPIVLMADCQTTGGYPKIATVIQADLGRLAQIRFGGALSFQCVDVETAQQWHKKNEVYLNQIKRIVDES